MAEQDAQAIMNEAYRRLNEVSRRLRAVEERYELIENRLTGLQETAIRNAESGKAEADRLSSSLKGMEERVVKLENDFSKIGKGIENTAKATEIAQLRSMIELWSPFKDRERHG